MSVMRMVIAFAAALVAAGDYEAPAVQHASQILPPALASGTRFKVDDNVPSDGFMPRFTVKSDFGEFVVSGNEMLAVRVHEINVLEKLEDVTKGDAFAKA